MDKKVLVGIGLQKPVLEKLRKFLNVIYIAEPYIKNNEQFLHYLKDADRLISSNNYMNIHLLRQAQNLKIISNVSI